MEEIEDRVQRFVTSEFFATKPHLIVKIIEKEMETGIKLPNRFQTKELKESVVINGSSITIGKVHNYYYLSIEQESGVVFCELFDNIVQFKYFFTKTGQLEQKEMAQWSYLLEILEEE